MKYGPVAALLIIIAESALINKREGEICREGIGGNWVCQILETCPQIGDFRRTRPDICDFRDKEPIVCCPPGERVESQTWADKDNFETNDASAERNKVSTTEPPVTSSPSKAPPQAILKCVEHEVKLCQSFLKNPSNMGILRGGTASLSQISKKNNDGNKANLHQFPFMSAVGYGEETNITWICGGTVVSERFVLSTASCAQALHGKSRWIGVSGNQMDVKFNGVTMPIANVTVHPLYNLVEVQHNIALFKLEHAFKFNDLIKPVCLHPLKVLPQISTGAGWGTTVSGGEEIKSLLTVDMELVDNDTCEQLYNSSFDKETMFCSGGRTKGMCKGGSGGPLFFSSSICLHVQVGIASYEKSCGTQPGLYTKISYYLPWIESIIWP